MHPTSTCNDCGKTIDKYNLGFPPVWHFGSLFDAKGNPKKIIVIGLNPHENEFKARYIAWPKGETMKDSDYAKLLDGYFLQKEYKKSYFGKLERFLGVNKKNESPFDSDVRKKLGWEKSPWESVAYIDLVKCVTEGGWASVPPQDKDLLVKNCRKYLLAQLMTLTPSLLIIHGEDVWNYMQSCAHSFSFTPSDLLHYEDNGKKRSMKTYKVTVRDGDSSFQASSILIQQKPYFPPDAQVACVRSWILRQPMPSGGGSR